MNLIEYIKKKNKILHKMTGIWLVPSDQIDEELLEQLHPMKLSHLDDSSACPYCLEFYYEGIPCDGCPMAEGGNECKLDAMDKDDNRVSTYLHITDILEEKYGVNSICETPEIKELVEKYRKSISKEGEEVSC